MRQSGSCGRWETDRDRHADRCLAGERRVARRWGLLMPATEASCCGLAPAPAALANVHVADRHRPRVARVRDPAPEVRHVEAGSPTVALDISFSRCARPEPLLVWRWSHV